MDKPIRPVEIWMLQSDNSNQPYCAMAVDRGMVGPRQYAPKEKRGMLRAYSLGWMTFHQDGLLCEGTSMDDIVTYIRSHPEVIATRKQLDAYYAFKKEWQDANI
jgi:hypothetical protein